MPDKQQLLATLRAEYNRWQPLLDGLNGEQAASALPDGLSVKDVTGHLHAWQQISVARLEAGAAGGEPVLPAWLGGLQPDVEENLERINATIHATYRDQPWPQVYETWRSGFLRLLDLAAAIPERDLFDAQRYAWLEGYSLADVLRGAYEHHHDEHYTPLITALRRQGWVEDSEGT